MLGDKLGFLWNNEVGLHASVCVCLWLGFDKGETRTSTVVNIWESLKPFPYITMITH